MFPEPVYYYLVGTVTQVSNIVPMPSEEMMRMSDIYAVPTMHEHYFDLSHVNNHPTKWVL